MTTKKQAGESLMRRQLDRMWMHSFKLTSEDGKNEIIPWDGKAAYGYEWLRNESALDPKAPLREEDAIFVDIAKDSQIYYNGEPRMKADLAVFSSNADGNKFDIGSRLLPKGIQPGDNVTLTILGCCSVVSVRKK